MLLNPASGKCLSANNANVETHLTLEICNEEKSNLYFELVSYDALLFFICLCTTHQIYFQCRVEPFLYFKSILFGMGHGVLGEIGTGKISSPCYHMRCWITSQYILKSHGLPVRLVGFEAISDSDIKFCGILFLCHFQTIFRLERD